MCRQIWDPLRYKQRRGRCSRRAVTELGSARSPGAGAAGLPPGTHVSSGRWRVFKNQSSPPVIRGLQFGLLPNYMTFRGV